MAVEDAVLLELADAVLEGRPFPWIAARAGEHESTRALIPHLQVVSDIVSVARRSSLSGSIDPADRFGAETLTPGSTWGPLSILGPIGRGSFGDVYRALDPRLDRPVALKLLRRERGPAAEATVVDEGRLMARVRHPNVVTVFGAERIDGRVGLWMEFVDGRSLEEELKERGPLPGAEVLRIGIDLCRALEAIHRAGLLHRDLKAQNVLRDRDGHVLVTDFGAGLDVTLTEAERDLAGTPLYLAPEVLGGAPASVQSDIYCIGVLLFHLLTASYPVTGRTLAEVRVAHRERRRLRVELARPDLDRGTVHAIERALALDPAARYDSAAAMETALAALLADGDTGKRVGGTRAWPTVGGLAMVAAVIALALARAIPMPAAWRNAERESSADAALVVPGKVPLPRGLIGPPSLDGRSVPYVDSDSRIHVWDVATGRSRLLAESEPGVESRADPVLSADGRHVAYVSKYSDQTWELRLLGSDGTGPRLAMARQSVFRPVPVEWSRDGRQILCWLEQKNGSRDLALVPVDGAQPRVIRSFRAAAPTSGARLSPDGRLVAVAITTSTGKPRTELSLLDVDGGEPRSLVEGVAVNSVPAWTPDGTGVFFLRESAETKGARDGWVVPVSNGGPSGAPRPVAANLGNLNEIHLADGGLLLRVINTVAADVYTLAFDPSGATPPGAPTRVSPDELGNHVAPEWSPDGRSLAYFRIRPAPAAGGVPLKTLIVKDLATGVPREVHPPLAFLGGYTPRWAPDGRSLVVWGSDDGGDARLGYYSVDVRTDQTRAVAVLGINTAASSEFTRDGRAFVYLDPRRGIVSRELSSGEERVVVADPGIGQFRLAPDGRAIAYLRWTGGEGNWSAALVAHVFGQTPRELLRVHEEALKLHAWTPDGQGLLYTRAAGGRPQQLWRVSPDGGEPRELPVSFIRSGGNEPNGFSLSSNGRRIAYTERVVQSELWLTPLSLLPN